MNYDTTSERHAKAVAQGLKLMTSQLFDDARFSLVHRGEILERFSQILPGNARARCLVRSEHRNIYNRYIRE